MNARVVARVAAVVAIAGAAAAFAHATRSLEAIARAPTIEDAFYAMTVARNAALGHGLSTGTATTFAPTDGVQPLWTIALVPFFWASRGDAGATLRAVSALSTCLFVALAVVVGRRAVGRARRLGVDARASGAIASALVLGSFAMFAQTHDGLETALHLTTVGLAVATIGARAPVAVRAAALAIACWARLDAALLAVAYACVGLDARRRVGKVDRGAVFASVVAIASLGPWVARSVRLHGDWMPTSGAAESLGVDVFANARAAALSIDRWLVPSLHRPTGGARATQLLDVAIATGVAAALLAAAQRRRRSIPNDGPRDAFDDGDRTLALYVVLLATTYVTRFAAPHFMARFLAPTALLTTPLVATWLARRPRRALALLVASVALDGAWYARSLADDPPGRPNRNLTEQLRTARARVRSECVVGAGQSGTLGFFRDRVVNLDGKVDADSLRARRAGALPAYVRASTIDAVIDWPVYLDEILGARREGFHRVVVAGEEEHQLWVRDGRDECLLPP